MNQPPDYPENRPTVAHAPDATKEQPEFHAGDVDLVRKLLEEDDAARREFEQRICCVPRILRSRNARLGNPLTDQELPVLVQDTLAVIWRKLPEFEGRAALETWIYRICTFELMNAIRRKRRAVHLHGGAESHGDLEWIPSRSEELPYRLRFEDLYRGLSRIPSKDERILRLKHYDGKTFEEIAGELGLTASGVKHHYYRALKLLREHMPGPSNGGES